MDCAYCNEEVDGKVIVDGGKIYHYDCLIDYNDEHNAATYPFIDEDYLEMDELAPYLEDTVNPNKWVIIRSCREYGIYDVVSVNSEEEAIDIIGNPNFDGNGYDRIDDVYHDSKRMDINTAIILT